MDTEKKHTQDKPDSPILSGLKGFSEVELFSKDFFIKHWKKVIGLTILLFLYISNRYTCLSMIAEIENLKRELVDIRYEALTRSSELIGISRPSQVKELVRKNGIEIEESDKPSYNLND